MELLLLLLLSEEVAILALIRSNRSSIEIRRRTRSVLWQVLAVPGFRPIALASWFS